jgi:hypothetical protein
MSETERKKMLVELESGLRRSETALAIAQAEYEKAYAALWSYTNEASGEQRTVVISPGVTMH